MKNFKSLFLAAFCLISVSALVPNTNEAQASDFGAGILLGPTFGNSSTFFTYGVTGNYKIMSPWGVGASLTRYSTSTTIGTNKTDSSLTTITAQGTYSLAQYLPGLRAGAQLGLGLTSASATIGTLVASASSTSFIIGPMAGYDFNLNERLSVGGEGNLFFSTATGSSAFFQLLGTLKYWF